MPITGPFMKAQAKKSATLALLSLKLKNGMESLNIIIKLTRRK